MSYVVSWLGHHVVNVMVYVILFTELVCEGQAGEMLQPVPINWVKIKPNNEGREQSNVEQYCHNNEDSFPVCVKSPKGDVWQEGEGKQHAAEEAKNVGNVINPWQKTTEKEEQDDAQQFQKGLPRLLQHLPSLEQLNKEAGKESKLRPCWTHLQRKSERKKNKSQIIL